MTDEREKARRRVSVVAGYSMKPDGSIEFQPDVPEDVRRQILDEHAQQLDDQAQRRTLWGEIGPGSMTRLAKMFPSLRDVPGVEPWDATRLLEWLCGPAPTSGSTWAALFVLGVWHDDDWQEVARNALPERECSVCGGLGRVSREDGDRVLRGAAPDSYVRNRYDDDDRVIGQAEVEISRCRLCDGKGRYVPSPAYGRFNVFAAVNAWDRPHRAAFEAWVKFPFIL